MAEISNELLYGSVSSILKSRNSSFSVTWFEWGFRDEYIAIFDMAQQTFRWDLLLCYAEVEII